MTTTTPELQPQPDALNQAIVYLAFPENDIELSNFVRLASKVWGCEGVAFSYANGQPGVKPVLVSTPT